MNLEVATGQFQLCTFSISVSENLVSEIFWVAFGNRRTNFWFRFQENVVLENILVSEYLVSKKTKQNDKKKTKEMTKGCNVKKLLLVREGFPKSLKRTTSRALFAPRRRRERITNNSKVDRERTSEDWHPGDERMEINLV